MSKGTQIPLMVPQIRLDLKAPQETGDSELSEY